MSEFLTHNKCAAPGGKAEFAVAAFLDYRVSAGNRCEPWALACLESRNRVPGTYRRIPVPGSIHMIQWRAEMACSPLISGPNEQDCLSAQRVAQLAIDAAPEEIAG